MGTINVYFSGFSPLTHLAPLLIEQDEQTKRESPNLIGAREIVSGAAPVPNLATPFAF